MKNCLDRRVVGSNLTYSVLKKQHAIYKKADFHFLSASRKYDNNNNTFLLSFYNRVLKHATHGSYVAHLICDYAARGDLI